MLLGSVAFSRAGGAGALPGFTPESRTLLVPILKLAPPGPERNARSLKMFDRFLEFYPKIAFHFYFTPELQQLVEKLPPRQSILIRAGSLYSRDDIPWLKRAPNSHYLAVRGRSQPDGAYQYSLTPSIFEPERPGDFTGWFSLRPTAPMDGAARLSVLGSLGAQLQLDAFGAAGAVDFAAAVLRECYGDLTPPWDLRLGEFNHHDRAALARLEREMPALFAEIIRYFEFNNIIDEVPAPATGPCAGQSPLVVFNLDTRIRLKALDRFPRLAAFYNRIAPMVSAHSSIDNDQGDRLLDFDFDRGRIRMRFLVCAGALVAVKPPFSDGQAVPAADPVVLDQIDHGHYHAVTSGWVHRFRMDFGLQNIAFATDYRRKRDIVKIESRMTTPPEIVAPPGIRQISLLLADDFMEALAHGNDGRGVDARFSSTPSGVDGTLLSWEAQAELVYSPMLEFLARIGDSIADAHNQLVREDERRLWREIFDAV
ncbi:MAG TPA: hypothetical protein VGI47_10805, partial [Candidatus Binataceae bacterium]